ncbi:bifunctional folylpolyglutamate synthase/dihydrofolate synthase [Candidatus Woesearchaeota archaeon]|jgi:dihydrofolate synthase / folylpolyglutamate synthase|nr:bifunctional folylpolyglutamate synthase/dihydrofolate synthase [Candidatus Woesearchaeota archaeon]MBT4110508.1 bifunctional folylpolyglutamate synthase/dihydrofolate synthase [Candidatus Woesearchaeota archaeon]MBT4335968.1 bifunctional folylpolyglutamate synthase/dihydrofolate synthase [Candidatus Woesearchaeota archaeon]MBT4469053.1 bifunctional folylpolyglutamate synthase/dihydrofolate synthase [Candidatus Woesearchaeota archaeon]MBT6744628.1 bifunctional folylpolyglutamate synthase/dih
MMKEQVLDYLYGLKKFGDKLRLEEMEKLVSALDNPQNKFKSIHIAGTNGKGSTAAFLAQILEEAGYKVGLYTSPHLVNFNERIKINGKDISDENIVELTKIIREQVETNNIDTTFFEFTTAMAFQHFANEGVDFAIIEVGLGGRLDATNVIDPDLCVITNVSLEHTKILGETKEEIAKEKAAIIKEKKVVITAETDPIVLNIFENKCKEKNSFLVVLDDQLKYKINKSNFNTQTFTVKNNTFTIKMLGEHQIRNACLALLIAKQLEIPINKVKWGLEKTLWAGRLQTLQENPLLMVDGAHNIAGIKYLVNFVKTIRKRKILVLGIAKDKKLNEMVSLLVPLFEQIIVTEGSFKPTPVEELAEAVKEYNPNVKIVKDSEEAVKEALNIANEDDFVLVSGSLYLIGDILHKY